MFTSILEVARVRSRLPPSEEELRSERKTLGPADALEIRGFEVTGTKLHVVLPFENTQ